MKQLQRDQSEGRGLPTSWISHPGTGLFLASFLSLFLELLLIRWVPSLIRIVAYYGNLMLISSFLGLGCGVLVAHRRLGLYQWFAPLLLLLVLFVTAMKGINFRQGPDELRFLFAGASSTTTLPIVSIFVLNALVFVPLGELMGDYFQRMSPLRAYSWDLGGAITGTGLFGLFSYFWFSPILGCIIVMGFYLIYSRGVLRLIFTGLLFIASLGIMVFGSDDTGIWSPYNHITVKQTLSDGKKTLVSGPLSNIGTMRDPPFFIVQVNHDFYMMNGTIDRRRYTESSRLPSALIEQYALPHLIRPGGKDILVVGSGGGIDVEAALLYGAERVDAVEIDPVIIQLGHRYNASQSYKDPRVAVHNTDARAFFKQANRSYDVIVFGFLDSQGLFSQMSNIRLDGYVYTRESFQEAFGLLRPGGLMSISFFSAGKEWLIGRLSSMVRSVTGADPLVYLKPTGQVIILAGKGVPPLGPPRFISYQRMEHLPSAATEALDDWPYLYLRQRFVPLDYLITIGVLLVISVLCILFRLGKEGSGVDLHFFFLGAGFLLLETKSITTISLYFGNTWFVSMLVILGVLIMVFLANVVASRCGQSSLLFYLPLLVSIAFLYSFPTQNVLAWPFFSRLMYSLVIIPLPIFFAGLIFSSTFRESRDSTFSFGSNLLGAMVGGFAEYLGMVTGTKALLLVVIVFYLASLLMRLRLPQVLPSRLNPF